MRDSKQDLSIDDILRHIRSEVEQRKHRSAHAVRDDVEQDSFPDVAVKESGLFRLIKKIQFRLMRYSFYHSLYGVAVRFKKFIPRYKRK